MRSHQAVAQSAALFIVAAEIDVVPCQIDNYLAAIKENAAASIKEPGCHEFNVAVSQKDPNHVLLFEVYDNAAAPEAHSGDRSFQEIFCGRREHGGQARASNLFIGRHEYEGSASCETA